MSRIHQCLILLFAGLFLFACSDDDKKDDNTQIVIEQPALPQEPETSTIKGTIKIASNILRDGTINDKGTPLIQNSTLSTAQAIPNLVTIQGFVTAEPTANFYQDPQDAANDRYYLTTDEDDYYIAKLQAGQVIQLQVVNFSAETTDTVFSGDIDLYLFNQKDGAMSASTSYDEFEIIEVPEDGTYYINAFAFEGASKYVLNILPANSDNQLASEKTAVKGYLDFRPNELIVQYSDSISASAASTGMQMQALHSDVSRPTLVSLGDTSVAAQSIHPQFKASKASKAKSELANRFPEAYEKFATINKLKAIENLEHVEMASLNYIRHTMLIPSDPLYPLQWHYPAMNLPQAWDITTGTPASGSVIVAVVDTGIVHSHPDLTNKIVPGYDFIREQLNSRDDEPGIDNNPEDPGDSTDIGSSSWHGTHVAGTIAAQSDNNIGIAGVSWGAKIMPLRVLGTTGGNTYDIMQAMRFAAGLENDSGTVPEQPADIINLSLGGSGSSLIEAQLYKQIYDLGIIIVAAAGNDNSSLPAYPASYEGVISVSAVDASNQRAPYSNFGSHIDIAAPGGDMTKDANGDGRPDGVLSTLIEENVNLKKPSYQFYNGTSMAAPHVSGMFALMKAVYPSLTAKTAHELLIAGSLTNPAGAPGRDNIFGYGTANALKAVQEASRLANGGSMPEIPPILQASPSSLSFSSGTQANLTITNQGGGSPSLISVVPNKNWISAIINNPTGDGFGIYRVSVNPALLDDGFHTGHIMFHFDNNAFLKVNVNLQKGITDSGGQLAKAYVLLYDLEAETVIREQQAIRNQAGDLVFRYDQVEAGYYVILAGTDIDNDFFICQLGEGCAIYPETGQISAIDTTEPKTFDIEMTANILNTLNNPGGFSITQALLQQVQRSSEDSKFKRTLEN